MAEAVWLYGPAALAWTSTAVKAWGWRRRRPEGGLMVWVLLLGLSSLLTLQLPDVYRAVGSLTGVPNLARLLTHVAMLVVVLVGQAVLVRMRNPRSVVTSSRAAFWWLVAAVAVMGVLFVLADTPVDDPRFAGRYGSTPWVLEYWLVFLAALMPALVNVIRLAWQYAALTAKVAEKVGLRLVALGTTSAMVYHWHKALLFAARRFDFGYPKAFSDVADRLLPLVASVLVLLGATLPSWGPRVGLRALWSWFGEYRTYLGLRPLWVALYRANPQIALVPPPPLLLDVLSPRDIGLRLYRRVIEIRDGRLALQPYFDPRHVVRTSARPDARAEAATLHAAVRARASGSAPLETAPAVAVPGGHDLESDIAFLTEVARAYRRLRRAGVR